MPVDYVHLKNQITSMGEKAVARQSEIDSQLAQCRSLLGTHAADLIRLSGLELGRDIDIVFTGLRPGEKQFEELFLDGETYRRTEHQQIFIAANGQASVPDALAWAIPQLYAAAETGDRDTIVTWLQRLVPEYQPRDGEGAAGAGLPFNYPSNYTPGLANGRDH